MDECTTHPLAEHEFIEKLGFCKCRWFAKPYSMQQVNFGVYLVKWSEDTPYVEVIREGGEVLASFDVCMLNFL